jgi:asparagine synthase (glutamine-hydrolysing)
MTDICGISGIIGRFAHLPEKVRAMVRPLHSESSPFSGQLTIDTPSLSIAWTCHNGIDQEPAWNESRDVCALVVGELVPDDLPLDSKEQFEDRLDARYVVRLYEESGASCFEKLNGLFSGLLVDLREHRAILFNDRYGLSRIYYHEFGQGLLFSSEAKSLLAALPQLRRIDQRGLAEFFAVGCTLQNRTIFSDISLLPGGSRWTFGEDGRIEKLRYFAPETWELQEALDPITYSERLTELFARTAPRYISTSKRAALSLTGGLDSRMILAWARPEPATLPCYTFVGPYRDCADVRIARRLAALCGQSHTTISIADDFFEDFPSLAEKTVYVSDGTMDVSGAVELYVNRRAREIAPIRLTGNYGSEILRSHVAFGPRRLDRSLFTPEFSGLLDGAVETYRSEGAGHRLSFIAFKQVPWHHYSRLSVEKSQLTPRSPFLDNELVRLAYQAPPELVGRPEPLLQLIANGNRTLSEVGTDRALRSGSSSSLTRLARTWQEFTAKAEYAYDYGMPRWLTQIDRLLGWLHPERLFLGHHKFYHFRIWYRERLGSYLRHAIDSSTALSCFRPGVARRLVSEHLAGRCNHTLALHKMLTTQLIARLFGRI